MSDEAPEVAEAALPPVYAADADAAAAANTAPQSPAPVPQPTPPRPTFSLRQLDGTDENGNAMVEFTVMVQQGARYHESIWNEVQTPEIARLFAEMVAAEAALEAKP